MHAETSRVRASLMPPLAVHTSIVNGDDAVALVHVTSPAMEADVGRVRSSLLPPLAVHSNVYQCDAAALSLPLARAVDVAAVCTPATMLPAVVTVHEAALASPLRPLTISAALPARLPSLHRVVPGDDDGVDGALAPVRHESAAFCALAEANATLRAQVARLQCATLQMRASRVLKFHASASERCAERYMRFGTKEGVTLQWSAFSSMFAATEVPMSDVRAVADGNASVVSAQWHATPASRRLSVQCAARTVDVVFHSADECAVWKNALRELCYKK